MGVNAQLRDVDATRATLLDAISSLAPTAAQWWQYSVSHGRFLLCLDGSAHSELHNHRRSVRSVHFRAHTLGRPPNRTYLRGL